jgi:uncharacterized cupin superfamily protein
VSDETISGVRHAAAVLAIEAPARVKPSNYPEPFASRMNGRIKHPLGDLFGLTHFGVNLTRLKPGGVSALHHRHTRQDEFIYVLEGEPVLYTDAGATQLRPGMCAGFPAGGTPHHLANHGTADVVILEVGDRVPGDEVSYPDDDIAAVMGEDGKWRYSHKDGTSY